MSVLSGDGQICQGYLGAPARGSAASGINVLIAHVMGGFATGAGRAATALAVGGITMRALSGAGLASGCSRDRCSRARSVGDGRLRLPR